MPDFLNGIAPANGLLESAVVILLVLTARLLIVKGLRRGQDSLSTLRKRWISLVENGSILLIILGLFIIWSPELGAFALSITAFAVALAIITKDFLMSLVGALPRAVTRPFEVGDWISFGGIKGEVLSEGLLAFRIQEIDSSRNDYRYTGRILSIPNSVLFNTAVHNEAFMRHYVFHAFRVVFDPGGNPFLIVDEIAKRAQEYCTPFEVVAQRYWAMLCRRLDTKLPGVEPEIRVRTIELSKIMFEVTVFCPTAEAVALEQKITADIFELYTKLGKTPPAKEE